MDDDTFPDESPIDIAAAVSLVPLLDDIDQDLSEEKGKVGQKQAYLRYLFGTAQQTGTSLRSYLPSRLPMVEMPKCRCPASLSRACLSHLACLRCRACQFPLDCASTVRFHTQSLQLWTSTGRVQGRRIRYSHLPKGDSESETSILISVFAYCYQKRQSNNHLKPRHGGKSQ